MRILRNWLLSIAMIKLLLKTSLIKSVWLNFRYFSVNEAVKFPILVSKNVVLKNVKGRITIKSGSRLYLGFGDVDIFDKRRDKTSFSLKGDMILKGDAFIGHGSSLSIASTGTLTLGSNFRISANSDLICHDYITFGDDVLISWNVQIIDCEFHRLYKLSSEREAKRGVIIGSKVWINIGALILPGSQIPDGCIVFSRSVISSAFNGKNKIIGRTPDLFETNGCYQWEN